MSIRPLPSSTGRSPWGLFRCDEITDDDGQVKAQRFFHDAAQPGHPGISIVRPSPTQRLRFGDFGRRLAPSGEVLAWLVAKGTWDFTNKRILELGSGLGLPGMACAAWTNCGSVHLSDGDPELVEVLRTNIAINQSADTFGIEGQPQYSCANGEENVASPRGRCLVQAAYINWLERSVVEDGGFDVILCADCVYDTELQIPLLLTLRRYLRPDGKVILMASPRAGSLEIFLNTARAFFGSVTCSVNYDAEVSHRFRGHKCFPQLVALECIDSGHDDDFSILEDEYTKRFVERRRRSLLLEQERDRQISVRYLPKREGRTTALKHKELTSMIERMTKPKTRSSRVSDEGGEYPCTSRVAKDHSAVQTSRTPPTVERPRTSDSISRHHDMDTIRSLREPAQREPRILPNTPLNRIGRLGSSQEEKTEAGRLRQSSESTCQELYSRGTVYYHHDEKDNSKTSFSFYKHLLDAPQRPVNPAWTLSSCDEQQIVGRRCGSFHARRHVHARFRLWQERRNKGYEAKLLMARTPAWQTRQLTTFQKETVVATCNAEEHSGQEIPQTIEQTLCDVYVSSGDVQRGSAQQRCNPWDGVGNRGHGATQTHRGEALGGAGVTGLVTPAPHDAGQLVVHILGNKSGSLQATSSVHQSNTPQICQENSSFITAKDLTKKMRNTSIYTKEGENLRRLLASIRQLERS